MDTSNESTRDARIWSGDQSAVAETRQEYHDVQSREKLLAHACALYSFRYTARYASELISLRYELIDLARRYVGEEELASDSAQSQAATADALSTYLGWLSNADIFKIERDVTHVLAQQLCQWGINKLESLPNPSRDSLCLLLLTAASLAGQKTEPESYNNALARVWINMQRIQDRNQRARIYRKYGYLRRKQSRGVNGTYWMIRACFVPGISFNSRMKSAAAILGFVR